ncbi:MAG: tetratricopeptide repeat protein [Phycisphaerae bacterium]
MNLKATFSSLSSLLAGRWQLPMAVLAALSAVVAVQSLRPASQKIDFDQLLTEIRTLAERGKFHDAVDSAANLIAMTPPLPNGQKATLHAVIADIIAQQESRREKPLESNVRLLLEHDEKAVALGRERTAADDERTAKAYEWLESPWEAAGAYRALLGRSPEPEQRRAALKSLVAILEGWPAFEDERREYLDALLADPGVEDAYAWWALQRAVREAIEHRALPRARELVDQYAVHFDHPDLKGYYDYLGAWVLAAEGRWEEAEPLLRAVETWLDAQPRVSREMDGAGFLPALSLALRGEVCLGEQRPQEALTRFDEALALRPEGDTRVSAVVGRSRALDLLERTDTARGVLRDLAKSLSEGPSPTRLLTSRVPVALMSLYDRRRKLHDYDNALAYLQLALQLTPADNRALRADQLEAVGYMSIAAAETHDAKTARPLHREAALGLIEASTMIEAHEPRYADVIWDAAREFDRARMAEDSRRLYQRFLAVSNDEARRPTALLRLGLSNQLAARYADALKWYDRLIAEYPRSLDAARAKLRSADCYLAAGPDGQEKGEAILLGLLEDDVIEPSNPIFREALLTLSDALYERGQFGQAIGRIEDFLALYPDDPQRDRAIFRLAEAHRRSALALRSPAPGSTPNEGDGEESRRRLQRAVQLYGDLLSEKRGTADEQGEELERLALLGRADCLYELNEPGTLDEALSDYRQAAARHRFRPTALTAQVQIANIQLRQGKRTEAARSVERARWLLKSIPDRAFEEQESGAGRDEWDGYLAALASSLLFRDVLTDKP